jgi:hypothetical protein
MHRARVLVRVNDEGAEAAAAVPALLDALGRHAGAAEPLRRDERAPRAFLFEDEAPRPLRNTPIRAPARLSLRYQPARHGALAEPSRRRSRAAGAARHQLNTMMMRLAAWSGSTEIATAARLVLRHMAPASRKGVDEHPARCVSVQAHDDEPPRLRPLAAESASPIGAATAASPSHAGARPLLTDDEPARWPSSSRRSRRTDSRCRDSTLSARPRRIALPALARVRLADVELCRIDGKRLRLEEPLSRTQGICARSTR